MESGKLPLRQKLPLRGAVAPPQFSPLNSQFFPPASPVAHPATPVSPAKKGALQSFRFAARPLFCALREILRQQKRPSEKSFTAPASIRNSHCILTAIQIYYRRIRAANGILPVSIKSAKKISDIVNLLPASCIYKIDVIFESRKGAAGWHRIPLPIYIEA